jgi:hypothetical protein
MPRPVFIACAQIATQDRDTTLLSLTNVIEQIAVSWHLQTDKGKPIKMIHMVTFSAVAVWGKEEGDTPDTEYEAEMVIRYAGIDRANKLPNFRFDPVEDALHRFVTHVTMEPPETSGTVLAECRVRELGTEAWMTQQYRMRLVVHGSPENFAKKTTARKTKGKKRDNPDG